MWPAVRRVMPESVRDKVQIVGDPTEALAALAEPGELPADYGFAGPPLGEGRRGPVSYTHLTLPTKA